MNLILFDTEKRNQLYPFTLTRAIADVRMGILTIKERWQKLAGLNAFVLTASYLQPLYEKATPGEAIFIDASVLPSKALTDKIFILQNDEALQDENGLIAGRTSISALPSLQSIEPFFKNFFTIPAAKRLTAPWQIFQWNEEMISFDFDLITRNRETKKTDGSNQLINPTNIFIEEGATVHHSILNATGGAIYIGKNATIMEGNLIRGAFAMNEGAVLKMGSKVYGATTLGPYCTGGGEIKNSVLMGYSNKAHDGYLGDSVLGEWCNLGAGTTVSNVKNTGSDVKVWDESSKQFISAGKKCGMLMGDYSRTAINASINTGTVVGVNANVFGSGLSPKKIKDFSWGFNEKIYDFEKAASDINNWKKIKNKSVTQNEKAMLKHIFDQRNYHEKV